MGDMESMPNANRDNSPRSLSISTAYSFHVTAFAANRSKLLNDFCS